MINYLDLELMIRYCDKNVDVRQALNSLHSTILGGSEMSVVGQLASLYKQFGSQWLVKQLSLPKDATIY